VSRAARIAFRNARATGIEAMEKLGVASLMVVVSGVLFAAGCAGRGAGDSGTASGAVEAGIGKSPAGRTRGM